MSITREEFRILLEKYLKGGASADEVRLLDTFFDSFKDEVKATNLTFYEQQIKDEMLQKIHLLSEKTVSIKNNTPRVWYSIAAAIAFVLTATTLLFYFNKTDIPTKLLTQQTTRGQRLSIVLPDGTEVRLNGNSILQYPESFSQGTREVTLKGEGYFKVTRNTSKPFIVHTDLADTKVLGTTFNVNTSADGDTKITLVEGKVNVSPNGEKKYAGIILTPNEQAIVNEKSSEIIRKNVDVNKVLGWKNNTIFFTNNTLAEAVRVLESWYDVDIRVENPSINNCVINGTYKNQSLTSVLNSFKFLLGIEYHINKNVIVITGKVNTKAVRPKQTKP